jgi:hypothetical protein
MGWVTCLGWGNLRRSYRKYNAGCSQRRAANSAARGQTTWKDPYGGCGSGFGKLRPGSRTGGTSDGRIVLLTVFRKTRQHEQRQIGRAVRAQKTCERDHHGPATQTYAA